jgi:hypothetical protein
VEEEGAQQGAALSSSLERERAWPLRAGRALALALGPGPGSRGGSKGSRC